MRLHIMGIDTGILTNATPLTAEQAIHLEKQVADNGEVAAYLNEDGEICFAVPTADNSRYVEGIKDLAWHRASEVHKLASVRQDSEGYMIFRRDFKKSGLDTFIDSDVFCLAEDLDIVGSSKEYWAKFPEVFYKTYDKGAEPLGNLESADGLIPEYCTIKRQVVGQPPQVFNAGSALPVLQQGDLIIFNKLSDPVSDNVAAGSGMYMVMQEGFSSLQNARHAFLNQMRWALYLEGMSHF